MAVDSTDTAPSPDPPKPTAPDEATIRRAGDGANGRHLEGSQAKPAAIAPEARAGREPPPEHDAPLNRGREGSDATKATPIRPEDRAQREVGTLQESGNGRSKASVDADIDASDGGTDTDPDESAADEKQSTGESPGKVEETKETGGRGNNAGKIARAAVAVISAASLANDAIKNPQPPVEKQIEILAKGRTVEGERSRDRASSLPGQLQGRNEVMRPEDGDDNLNDDDARK